MTKQKEVENFEANRSAILKHITTTGIFKWSFKIIKIVEPEEWDDFVIGIVRADVKDLKKVCEGFYGEYDHEAIGAGLNTGRGQLEIPPSYKHSKYGIACKTNDMIEMELNMNEGYVKYIINGKDYGKAFDAKEKSYRAVVYMYKQGDKLQLL